MGFRPQKSVLCLGWIAPKNVSKNLDLSILHLFQIVQAAKSVLFLGLDFGGDTHSIIATKLRNVTVVLRGLVSLQQ